MHPIDLLATLLVLAVAAYFVIGTARILTGRAARRRQRRGER